MITTNYPQKILLLTSLATLMSTVSICSQAKKIQKEESHGPIKDAGVINKERIIYWLIKRGELAKDASEKEKLAAFNRYISLNKSTQHDYNFELAGKPIINFSKKKDVEKSPQKFSQKSSVSTEPHKVNVLTLLIDFPNLPHDNNGLTSSDTSMFYDNYDAQHYQNLMFSPTGFEGPNGEELMSAHQYYLSESGGDFEFNGKVFGWLTANEEASFYGKNNESGNDQAATDLVKEALNKAVTTYNINLADFDLIDPADLDGDGIIAEPDGYIDYLMVFHSSIGADAGGGDLGDDAIWAHRWNINNYAIPNTNFRAHGYTIQGIDSAIGVVSHEFGHMVANLKDEYDTNDSVPNSPVGFWSLMSGGSWAGDKIPGAMPTGFSPLAKVQLQEQFGGNWVNAVSTSITEIKALDVTIDLVAATTHNEMTNLVDIALPTPSIAITPFSGSGQFHSSAGDNLNTSMVFKMNIPNTPDNKLTMKAYWDIESDWDYAQVLVDGVPIAGNHTIADNTAADTFAWYGEVINYISGNSNGWLDLSFDISAYQGKEITVSIVYSTDSNTGGSGLFIDDIYLKSAEELTLVDDAETVTSAQLTNFSQINAFISNSLSSQKYYIQLRNYTTVDKGLDAEKYDHGVLMWLANSRFINNQVSLHPGQGFISVIDADQNLAEDETYGLWWTSSQIRDAVFSLFDQREKAADSHLSAINMFDDQQSYISDLQPESGVILYKHGLKMALVEQAEDSSNAKIRLSVESLELTADFSPLSTNKNTINFIDESFGEASWVSYNWDFGDNSKGSIDKSPSHTYAQSGDYIVTLEVMNNNGDKASIEKLISTQGASYTTEINFLEVTFTNTSKWASENLTYSWDFGDGMQSDEESPIHIYESEGDYAVVLTATTATGEVLTSQKTITVAQVPPPIASFVTEMSDLKVHGINKTTNGAGKLLYSWDFGDGSYKISGTSPKHVYKKAGTYKITLLVEDSIGQKSQSSQSISVLAQEQTDAGSVSWLVWLMMLVMFRKKCV